eukprot:TRINITY_DN29430_c0_g1_i1.p1 TRINITY_DN29430_c0_g1~~TRINITY_DN29430_c0_g1_i1.p1  ORF type:complete len:554 (+),score=134.77 TRINITY_DN29430_c0_g1_i1:40-1701(+)
MSMLSSPAVSDVGSDGGDDAWVRGSLTSPAALPSARQNGGQEKLRSLKQVSVESRTTKAFVSTRLGSGLSTPRASMEVGSVEPSLMASTWVPLDSLASKWDQKPVLLQDRKMLAEIGDTMAGHLNQMYAFMSQAMSNERARHSSDVSLILRKVEKDLRETFDNVSRTFRILTDQMMVLTKEVEVGRAQVRNVQNKHIRTKEAVEAQSQYVTELEAVLESQETGVSAKFKELSGEAQEARVALRKLEEQSLKKERSLREEIRQLQAKIKQYEATAELENLTETRPPPLQEMPATWTHNTAREKGMSTYDVVQSVLTHCDAGRNAPRLKKVAAVKKPGQSPRTGQPFGRSTLPPVFVPRSSPSPSAGSQDLQAAKAKSNLAEARCVRLHRLLCKVYPSLRLLVEVSAKLREKGCFRVVTVGEDGFDLATPPVSAKSATETLSLSQLLRSLVAEAARLPPGVDPSILATYEIHGSVEEDEGKLASSNDVAQAFLKAEAARARAAEEAEEKQESPPISPRRFMDEKLPSADAQSKFRSSLVARLESFAEDEEDEDDL